MGEWSVPNPIQAPEFEKIVAVLQKRAAQEKVALAEDAALYLAQNFRSSTRALESALLLLITHASVRRAAITLTYTQQVLQQFIGAQSHQVDPFPKMPAEQSGTIEANIRRQNRVASEHESVFWLQTRDGRNNRRVRHVLEVNMRESERERLARWDVYERGLERRAKMRKQA